MVEAKVEAGQDVHLVIRDDHGVPTDRIIVEFPNAECKAAPPPTYLGLIRKARRQINDFIAACRTGGKNGWVQLHGTARIRGVGFFDLVHGTGQHGVAPNGVELHPALTFRGSC